MDEVVSVVEEKKLSSASNFFPWRRYFARTLDLSIYNMAFVSFYMLAFNTDLTGINTVFATIVSLVLMVIIEPLLISKFGTTIGKFVFGIYIRDKDEKLPTYSQAFQRTCQAMIFGMGLQIPLLTIYTNWKSYSTYKNIVDLPWEFYTNIYLKDKKFVRIIAYLLVCGLVIAMLVLSDGLAGMPKHRGDITVSEFVENYNDYLDYTNFEQSLEGVFMGGSEVRRLNANGEFTSNGISLNNSQYDFTISYIEEDGIMKGFEVTTLCTSEANVYLDTQIEILALSKVFVKSQKGAKMFDDEDLLALMSGIIENNGVDFTTNYFNLTCSQEVESEGYVDEMYGFLTPTESGKHYYKSVYKVNVFEY